MKKLKFLIVVIIVVAVGFVIYYVLSGNNALLTHPKGIIAAGEDHLMIVNILLMLIVVIPAFVLLYAFAWKYREGNRNAEYDPDRKHGFSKQIWLWLIPASVVVVMAVGTWRATFALDPYKPINSSVKPVTIQVVAMDWKWFFIYPGYGIATVNSIEIPEKTPINFALAADNAPMNSFWIPQLSGQIYAMPGMTTPLHVMASGIGTYTGRGAEIDGKGFSGMTFAVKSVTQTDFDSWVASVKQSAPPLTSARFDQLLQPSENVPPTFYSSVENGLYNSIVEKYMTPSINSGQVPTSSPAEATTSNMQM